MQYRSNFPANIGGILFPSYGNVTSSFQQLQDTAGNTLPIYVSSTQLGTDSLALKYQNAAPSGVASYVSLWANSTGTILGIRQATGANTIAYITGYSSFSAPRTFTLPDSSMTLAGIDVAQTFTANQIITGTTQFNALKVTGSTGGGILIGSYNATIGGIWSNNVTPASTNYMIASSGATTYLNGTSGINICISDSLKLSFGSTYLMDITSTSYQSTGSGTALLGSNSPATTLTAPFSWLKVRLNSGGTNDVCYIPVWK
jgi:hypothetical protein